MQLSGRLLALSQMVTQGSVLADVGCDHGYIPIYLMEQGSISSAIAMDVKEGPLSRARANIEAHGFTKYIETRLSDGLRKLSPGECDTILISGMGGHIIHKIIEEGRNVIENDTELILQPQSDVAGFRRFLSRSGFVIVQEDMVFEDGKYYPMMKVRSGICSYSAIEYMYGPELLRSKNPVLLEYLEYNIVVLESLEEKLSNCSNARDRLQEIREELELAKQARGVYES